MDRANFKRLLREYGVADGLLSSEGDPVDG